VKWPGIRRRIAGGGGFDFESFRRQQTTFAVLNLFVLAALLLFHTLFSTVLGQPSPLLLITLGTAFLLQLLEVIWLRTRAALSGSQAVALNWTSILFNLTLALLFTFFTNREESPYFVLLALPVVQAAYYSAVPALVAVIAVADSMLFFWVWHYATFHPPVHVSEYLRAGVIALIYSLVGVLVWSLVNRIRSDQDELTENMRQLEQTRLKLAQEEKFAAVGRLSSAIAHEIRNPVAMITSSLATAESAGSTEELRNEMYAIASSEASRLEKLTTDFLSYARPAPLNRALAIIGDLLGYIKEVATPYALRKQVSLASVASSSFEVAIDAAQVQRAVLNLVMNAIDAAPAGSTVYMRANRLSNGDTRIEIENSGEPITENALSRIFEPFYTTKPNGTGLGLAITRNIARAHGGDVILTCNEPQRICFALTLKNDSGTRGENELWAGSSS
jgi:two-component system, NtrC family, sensor histidine kinase HydH